MKNRFTPTLVLSVIDRSKKEDSGERVLKKVLCEDAHDADRVKRLFFRLLNTKLGLTQYGYNVDSYESEVAVLKAKKVAKHKKRKDIVTISDIDKEIERLQAMKEEAKKREVEQAKIEADLLVEMKKQEALDKAKEKILADAKKKIEELEKKAV